MSPNQYLWGDTVQVPLDGGAPAKLLQDGPCVVQVADCGQPHCESNALKG